MSIHQLIKAGRKRLEMTEQRFADAIGVSRGAVQQWEKGSTAPARKHQEAVAKLIGISVGELMSGASEKYPPQSPQTHTTSDIGPSFLYEELREAATLLTAMSASTRREALEYIRYLSKRPQPDFSVGAADSPGNSISNRSRAA